MQNLTKCPKRQYVVSRKLFNLPFTYEASKYGILKSRLMKINRDNGVNRLWLPVSYQTYKEIRKDFDALRAVFLQNSPGNSSQLSRLCNIRTFSTSASSSSNKENAGRDSSSGTTGDSDKDPKKSEERRMYFHKALFSMLITLFVLYTMKRSFQNSTTEVCLTMDVRYTEGTFEQGVYITQCFPIMTHGICTKLMTVNVQEMPGLSWNEFLYHMLAKGEVKEIVIKPRYGKATINLHQGAIIKGKRALFTRYALTIPDIRDFENKVRIAEKNLGIRVGEGVQIVYDRSEEYVEYFLQFLVTAIIIYAISTSRGLRSLPNPFNMFSQMTRAKFTLVEPLSSKGVRFEDVAGLKEAKIEVMEFIDYLKHPERYKTLGAKVPKGALLLGPPGCGKTLLAKAIATESNVPFLSMNGSEFIEMLGGLGAARVKDLFKEGKQRAPCIIYIDEIDAIGKKRAEQGIEFSNSESEQTLNQLLVEMDGLTSREDVIILASTNRAEVLDKALLRPGRFDRHILIDLPTLEERRQIFENHLRPLSLDGKPSKYSGYLAYLTPGFSGADIANVCNESALHAARDKKSKVDGSDLMYAIDRTIGGPTKKNNSMTPSTKKVVAYHEAGHALVGWLLEHTDALLKVTIVPRTNLNLGFAQYTQSDQKLYSAEALFEKMCMMLGGRVSEYLIFDKISTGAENDLKKVTKIAYNQVQQFGMSSNIGLLSFDEEYTSTKTKKPYSKKLSNLMDAEVRRIIGEAYATTKKLLIDNRDKLEKVAEALLEKETLTYEDIEKLIGPPPFGKKRLVEPAEFEKSVPDIEAATPEPEPTPS